MDNPLVSVIVLCYNQEKFVAEAIESVFKQDYEPIEIIIYDDASTDNSQYVIENFIAKHPEVKYIPGKTNLGNSFL